MAHPELRKLHDVVEKGNKEVVAQNPREDRNTAKNAMQIDSSAEKEDKSAKGKEANKAGHSQTMEIETHEDTEGWQTVPKGRGRNRTNKSTNVFTDQQTSNNETMHMKDDQTKVTAMCEESTAKATIPKHKGTPANNGQLTLPSPPGQTTTSGTKHGRGTPQDIDKSQEKMKHPHPRESPNTSNIIAADPLDFPDRELHSTTTDTTNQKEKGDVNEYEHFETDPDEEVEDTQSLIDYNSASDGDNLTMTNLYLSGDMDMAIPRDIQNLDGLTPSGTCKSKNKKNNIDFTPIVSND
ncbi:hypothetical protein KY289_009208 [Solanum tuberosum]|nr:hypothetical protein KY289_009208 [Solanum tuberosum]KAH0715774.1 hypothetical protein KY284_008679 [Solanum tuberosum]